MAAEGEIRFKVVPELSGLDDLIGQLRRTGFALEGLADSLARLSDGGPDAARTVPDTAACPFSSDRVVHDRHVLDVATFTPGTVTEEIVTFACPGWPDTTRTASDNPSPPEGWPSDYAQCPAAQRRTEHDGHAFTVRRSEPDTPGQTIVSEWRCAGHPARPWHVGGQYPDIGTT